MPSRKATWASLALAQAAGLAVTFPTPVGSEGWHHFASLGAVVALAAALAAALPGVLRSRRFLALGVLATTVLATASGFALLYWKEAIRADGYQDWGVFWHVAWSWAALGFFWQHTWINRVALAHFARRSLATWGPGLLHVGLYAAAVAAFAWSAGPGKTAFTVETYVPMSYWAWLACTAVAMGAWLALRGRREARLPARGGVDLGLVPVSFVAALSGIPLLFLDPQLEAAGLKYASKAWHVVPSVAFAVLAFAHSVQLWRTVRAHWRRVEGASAKAERA